MKRGMWMRGIGAWVVAAGLVGLSLGWAAGARGDAATRPATKPATQATRFVRFVEDGKGGSTLETAVVRYADEKGRTVDLVAAVHIGEKAYYGALEKRFGGYDKVLYEMVKSRAADVGEVKGGGGGAVSALQRFMKDRLGLGFQLDEIDYTAKNFVHADLDAETFFKMQEERGESVGRLMLRSMAREMGRQMSGQGRRQITTWELLAAMRSPDSARELKVLLGRQMEDMERLTEDLSGPNGSVLLTERNKAAVGTLKVELMDRKTKSLAIFYGAAHMPDIEERIEGMGFRKMGEEWLVAWEMPAGPATRPAAVGAGAATRAVK